MVLTYRFGLADGAIKWFHIRPAKWFASWKGSSIKIDDPFMGSFLLFPPHFQCQKETVNQKKQWILSNQSCSSASKMLLEKDSNLLCDMFSFRNWTHHNLVFHQTSSEYTFLNYHRHKSSARLKGDRFVFVNWSHQQGKSRCLVRSHHTFLRNRVLDTFWGAWTAIHNLVVIWGKTFAESFNFVVFGYFEHVQEKLIFILMTEVFAAP